MRPTRVTLKTFLVDKWLPAKRLTLRPSTANSYERMIDLYIAGHPIGGAQLAAVDGSMLNALYAGLLTEGRTELRRGLGPGLAPKTVRNVHGLLSKAFRDGVRWGRLHRNPCDAADPPSSRSPEMKAWNADELRSFTASTAGHRWAGVWALVATTGMRRGEVLGLRWSDVDLAAGTVTISSTRVRYGTTVTTSTPKTAAGHRTISVGPKVAAALEGVAAGPTVGADGDGRRMAEPRRPRRHGGRRFGPEPRGVSNLFGALCRRAGLRPIRLHDLRHGYATAALASGVPVNVVSQRLGHADITVTLEVYAHVLPGDDESAAGLADELLG